MDVIAPIDRAPIRSEGRLEVRDGQYIDLDSGKVGGETLPGASLLQPVVHLQRQS